LRKRLILLFVTIFFVGTTSCTTPSIPAAESTEPVTTEIEEQSVITEPVTQLPLEPTAEVKSWTDEELVVLAKMLWGEARGIKSKTEQAACVWCVLNRVDQENGTIIDITTAPYQFAGYVKSNPVDNDLKALCEDVVSRWYAEKDGETNVGRILPSDYLWFTGDGSRNYFYNAYENGTVWDWSLPSPYES